MNRTGLIDWILARLGMQLVPSVDHLALYRAKVTGQSSDLLTADLDPDDVRIPAMTSVPVEWPIGYRAAVEPNNGWMALGWKGGDPSKPFAVPLGSESGTITTEAYVNADAVYVGIWPGGVGAEPAAKGQTLKTYLDSLRTWLNSHTHQVTGVGTVCVNGAAWTGTATSAAPSASPAVPDVRADVAQVK